MRRWIEWKLGIWQVGKLQNSLVLGTGRTLTSTLSFLTIQKSIITLKCLITSPLETAIKCFSCGQSQRQNPTQPPTSRAVLQPPLSKSPTPFPLLASSLPNRANLNAKINCRPSTKQTPQKAHKPPTWTSASRYSTLNSTTSSLLSSCRITTRIISLQPPF